MIELGVAAWYRLHSLCLVHFCHLSTFQSCGLNIVMVISVSFNSPMILPIIDYLRMVNLSLAHSNKLIP
jgi:hypothetical protein